MKKENRVNLLMSMFEWLVVYQYGIRQEGLNKKNA